jgi:multiple sugar transport system substrate-binding protein
MKKLLLTAVLLLAALLLVQCTSAATPSVVKEIVKETVPVEKTVEVKSTVVVEKTVEVEKVVTPTPAPFTLTVWDHPIFADNEKEKALWAKLDGEFEAQHPGVKVDHVFLPWDVAFSKRIAAIQSGETPDVSIMGSDAAITFAGMGAVEPLDDVIQELGGPDAILMQHFCKWNDKYWCMIQAAGDQFLFYRKDVLEAAGYTQPPKTWEELVEVAQKVNKPAEDFYALGLDYSQGNALQQQFEGIMWQAGATMLNNTCDAITLNSPETRAAIQFYDDLYNKYKVLPPGVTAISKYVTQGTPLDEWYGTGKIAMTMRSNFAISALKANYPDIYAKTGFAPWPAGPAGRTGSFANEDAIFVHRGSKHIDMAKEYVKHYFQSKEWLGEYSDAAGALCPIQGCPSTMANEEWYKTAVEVAPNTVRTGFSCFGNPKNGSAEEAFILPVMVQDVVVRNVSLDEAIKNATTQYEELYELPSK